MGLTSHTIPASQRTAVELEVDRLLFDQMRLRAQANSLAVDDRARTTLQSRIDQIERRITALCGYAEEDAWLPAQLAALMSEAPSVEARCSGS